MNNLNFYNWKFTYDELGFQKEEQENIKHWIEKGINKDTIKYAETFGTYLAKKDTAEDESKNKIKNNKNEEIKLEALSTSQLRKFFGAIKALQNKVLLEQNEELKNEHINELLMLKPKLAYAVAHH